jgi:hypothetical protein
LTEIDECGKDEEEELADVAAWNVVDGNEDDVNDSIPSFRASTIALWRFVLSPQVVGHER